MTRICRISWPSCASCCFSDMTILQHNSQSCRPHGSRTFHDFHWYNSCGTEKCPLAVNGSHWQERPPEVILYGGRPYGGFVNSAVTLFVRPLISSDVYPGESQPTVTRSNFIAASLGFSYWNIRKWFQMEFCQILKYLSNNATFKSWMLHQHLT